MKPVQFVLNRLRHVKGENEMHDIEMDEAFWSDAGEAAAAVSGDAS